MLIRQQGYNLENSVLWLIAENFVAWHFWLVRFHSELVFAFRQIYKKRHAILQINCAFESGSYDLYLQLPDSLQYKMIQKTFRFPVFTWLTATGIFNVCILSRITIYFRIAKTMRMGSWHESIVECFSIVLGIISLASTTLLLSIICFYTPPFLRRSSIIIAVAAVSNTLCSLSVAILQPQ